MSKNKNRGQVPEEQSSYLQKRRRRQYHRILLIAQQKRHEWRSTIHGDKVLAFQVVAIFLLAWSGLYSVAASRGHWPGFELMLEFGMRSSVRTHALGIQVPALNHPSMIERGAGHFEGGCAPCHGSPARAPSPIARAMLPVPPDLSVRVPTWKPNELFWVVKNGLKYTGMPGWSAERRDDEVWALVAFLERLPEIDAVQYRALAGFERSGRDIPAQTLADHGPVGTAIAACSRCHGLDGKGSSSGAFPRLDIQSGDYLLAQLKAYAAGSRLSGIMQPVVAELDAIEMRQLADFYAMQRSDQPQVPAANETEKQIELGRTLATGGAIGAGIPPCLSCHTDDPAARHPLYPALSGQYASYIAGQLQLFKDDRRRGTAAADIMSAVAKRLTPDQIDAISLYFEDRQSPKATR